jgi:hypothetical protein
MAFMINSLKVLAVLAGGLFASTSANAVVLPSSVGPLDTGTSFNTVFNSTGGSSTILFDLLGYFSLDGVNCCTDTFHLSLNGTELFSGSYNLGGGGLNVTYLDLIGSSINGLNLDPNFNGFTNGSITISGILTLLSGSNTLTFAYDPGQGLGDEGWGVNNLNVSSVPVPPAALLLGTGLLGLAGLRRKAKKA